jgi:hypothetical protein
MTVRDRATLECISSHQKNLNDFMRWRQEKNRRGKGERKEEPMNWDFNMEWNLFLWVHMNSLQPHLLQSGDHCLAC